MHESFEASQIYLSELNAALENFPTREVEIVASLLINDCLGKTLFVVGNGGSATTASHMVTDLGVGSQKFGIGIRAISLVDNQGIITATANDLSYEYVFSEQLRLLGNENDFLIAFSASGNSKNLLQAFEVANQLNITTIAITGFNGGDLKKMADYSIHVPTKDGSYGVVEDLHSAISHMLTQIIRQNIE